MNLQKNGYCEKLIDRTIDQCHSTRTEVAREWKDYTSWISLLNNTDDTLFHWRISLSTNSYLPTITTQNTIKTRYSDRLILHLKHLIFTINIGTFLFDFLDYYISGVCTIKTTYLLSILLYNSVILSFFYNIRPEHVYYKQINILIKRKTHHPLSLVQTYLK